MSNPTACHQGAVSLAIRCYSAVAKIQQFVFIFTSCSDCNSL